jgi:hypothetical protein
MAYKVDKNKRGSYDIKSKTGLTPASYNSGRGANIPDQFFYELEPAEVIDIILDEKHPQFGTFSDIGKIRIRQLHSDFGKDDELLPFARPLDVQLKRYPLKHELVIVVEYLGELYYTQRLNAYGSPHHNAYPNISLPRIKSNSSTKSSVNEYQQISTSGSPNRTTDASPELGSMFVENLNIKPLKSFEGDTILEGRFGHSIRFGYNHATGNPNIKIRNEQPLQVDDTFLSLIEEDINNDGSSIWMLTDEVVSFNSATSDSELQFRSAENPPQEYSGRQIILTSDRIIWNSKVNDLIGFSKKAINFMSGEEFSVDCSGRFLTNSDRETVMTSPKIFLGGDTATEPVVLGDTLVQLLTELTNILIAHNHPTGTGPSGPPIQVGQLQSLLNKLKSSLSKRNFTL